MKLKLPHKLQAALMAALASVSFTTLSSGTLGAAFFLGNQTFAEDTAEESTDPESDSEIPEFNIGYTDPEASPEESDEQQKKLVDQASIKANEVGSNGSAGNNDGLLLNEDEYNSSDEPALVAVAGSGQQDTVSGTADATPSTDFTSNSYDTGAEAFNGSDEVFEVTPAAPAAQQLAVQQVQYVESTTPTTYSGTTTTGAATGGYSATPVSGATGGGSGYSLSALAMPRAAVVTVPDAAEATAPAAESAKTDSGSADSTPADELGSTTPNLSVGGASLVRATYSAPAPAMLGATADTSKHATWNFEGNMDATKSGITSELSSGWKSTGADSGDASYIDSGLYIGWESNGYVIGANLGQAVDIDASHWVRVDSGNTFTTGGDLPLALNTSYTASVWVKLDNVNGERFIMGTGTGGSGVGGFSLALNDGKLDFLAKDLAHYNFNNTPAISANQWYNFTIAYDGTTHKAYGYVNGTFVGEDQNPVTISDLKSDSNGLGIGSGSSDKKQSSFDGQIASLDIYGECLSADDIKARYSATALANVGTYTWNGASGNSWDAAVWTLDETPDQKFQAGSNAVFGADHAGTINVTATTGAHNASVAGDYTFNLADGTTFSTYALTLAADAGATFTTASGSANVVLHSLSMGSGSTLNVATNVTVQSAMALPNSNPTIHVKDGGVLTITANGTTVYNNQKLNDPNNASKLYEVTSNAFRMIFTGKAVDVQAGGKLVIDGNVNNYDGGISGSTQTAGVASLEITGLFKVNGNGAATWSLGDKQMKVGGDMWLSNHQNFTVTGGTLEVGGALKLAHETNTASGTYLATATASAGGTLKLHEINFIGGRNVVTVDGGTLIFTQNGTVLTQGQNKPTAEGDLNKVVLTDATLKADANDWTLAAIDSATVTLGGTTHLDIAGGKSITVTGGTGTMLLDFGDSEGNLNLSGTYTATGTSNTGAGDLTLGGTVTVDIGKMSHYEVQQAGTATYSDGANGGFRTNDTTQYYLVKSGTGGSVTTAEGFTLGGTDVQRVTEGVTDGIVFTHNSTTAGTEYYILADQAYDASKMESATGFVVAQNQKFQATGANLAGKELILGGKSAWTISATTDLNSQQVQTLTLHGDATVTANGNGGIAGPSATGASSMSLNNHTLTVKGGNLFALFNTTATDAGKVLVDGGRMMVGHSTRTSSANLADVVLDFANDGEFRIAHNSTVTVEGLSGSGRITHEGNANGTITIDADHGDYTFSGSMTAGKNVTMAAESTGTQTFNLSGNTTLGTVTVNGGTLNLSSTGTLTAGAVTVSAGTLDITSTLNTGALTMDGGTLALHNASALTTTGNLVFTSGTLDLTGMDIQAGNNYILATTSGGSLTLDNNNVTFTLNDSTLKDQFSLEQQGNSLVLTSSQPGEWPAGSHVRYTYTPEGTTEAEVHYDIQSGTAPHGYNFSQANDGVVEFNPASFSDNLYTDSSNIKMHSDTTFIVEDGKTVELTGVLTGHEQNNTHSGTLIKQGEGTLVMAINDRNTRIGNVDENIYEGSVQVEEGILEIVSNTDHKALLAAANGAHVSVAKDAMLMLSSKTGISIPKGHRSDSRTGDNRSVELEADSAGSQISNAYISQEGIHPVDSTDGARASFEGIGELVLNDASGMGAPLIVTVADIYASQVLLHGRTILDNTYVEVNQTLLVTEDFRSGQDVTHEAVFRNNTTVKIKEDAEYGYAQVQDSVVDKTSRIQNMGTATAYLTGANKVEVGTNGGVAERARDDENLTIAYTSDQYYGFALHGDDLSLSLTLTDMDLPEDPSKYTFQVILTEFDSSALGIFPDADPVPLGENLNVELFVPQYASQSEMLATMKVQYTGGNTVFIFEGVRVPEPTTGTLSLLALAALAARRRRK